MTQIAEAIARGNARNVKRVLNLRGEDSTLDTAAFGGLLSATEDTVQKALDKLDDIDGSTLSAVVLKSLFDANTILKADADNTPEALTVAEQRLVGRITGGEITALTAAQVLTLLGIGDAPEVFRSTGSAITANSTHTFAHGLSGEPDTVIVILECTTANLNWADGDRIVIGGATWEISGLTDVGITVQIDGTNVTVYVADQISILDKSGFESDPITLTSWDMYVKAVFFP